MIWLQIGLCVVVTLVWLVGYVLAYVNGSPMPQELSVLMGLVLGWALGGTILDAWRTARKAKNGNGEN